MHPSSVSLLHVPLNICPSKEFVLLGTIESIERGLTKTTIKILVVDHSQEIGGTDLFTVILYNQIKSLADKLLHNNDLIHCIGHLNQKGEHIELEGRYFTSWNGMKSSWSDEIPQFNRKDDQDLAY